jgi:hypothetical protein
MLPLDHYYFLLHAFDRLGRHLYGEEWTGDEFRAQHVMTRAELEREHERLGNELREVEGELRAVTGMIGRSAGATVTALKAEETQLTDRCERLRQRYWMTPKPDGSDDVRFRDHERCRRTRETLFDALEAGSLQAEFIGGPIVDWVGWCRQPGFRVCLEFSFVILPRTAATRRGSVVLRRVAFEEWSKSVLPASRVRLEGLAPFERCRLRIQELGRTISKPRKKVLRDQLKREIPELLDAEFNRAWELYAPAAWKSKGRPRREK